MTKTITGLEIRELSGVAELKQAEDLQTEVWGKDDIPDNSDLMLAIQHEGGLVSGAFFEEKMVAFLFAFPSSEQDIQHSHRLAVRPDSRGMGLGEKMKWHQRDWCLKRGIKLIRWTYDPVRRINAGLNIAKLGATVDTYYNDFYGQMDGINAGAPSDRLLAEWDLDAPWVKYKAGETIHAPLESNHNIRVTIPADFQSMLSTDIDQALAERFRIRKELNDAFSNGYRITDFNFKDHTYLLSDL